MIEEGAQEYQIANRRLTKANLVTLYARENSLMAAISPLPKWGAYDSNSGEGNRGNLAAVGM